MKSNFEKKNRKQLPCTSSPFGGGQGGGYILILILIVFNFNSVLYSQSIDIVDFFKNNKRILPTGDYPFESPLIIKDLKIKSVKEYKIDLEKNDTVLVKLVVFDTLGFKIQEDSNRYVFDESYKIKDIINMQTNQSVLNIGYGIIDGHFYDSKFYRYLLNRNPITQLIESNEVIDFNMKKHKLMYHYNTKVVYDSYCFNVGDLDVWVDNTLPIFLEKLEYYQNDKLIQINYLEVEKY